MEKPYFCKKNKNMFLVALKASYRKFFCSKGHGVHSPFVFNLITKVIEDSSPFYAFEDIEKSIDKKDAYPVNYGRLLFRIINYFKFSSVLLVGDKSITKSYISRALPKNGDCCIMNGTAVVIDSNPELIVIDQWTEALTEECIYHYINRGSVLIVVNNILKDKRMSLIWNRIKNDPEAKVTMDLLHVGLVFIDDKLPKKHYKTYFNYG